MTRSSLPHLVTPTPSKESALRLIQMFKTLTCSKYSWRPYPNTQMGSTLLTSTTKIVGPKTWLKIHRFAKRIPFWLGTAFPWRFRCPTKSTPSSQGIPTKLYFLTSTWSCSHWNQRPIQLPKTRGNVSLTLSSSSKSSSTTRIQLSKSTPAKMCIEQSTPSTSPRSIKECSCSKLNAFVKTNWQGRGGA